MKTGFGISAILALALLVIQACTGSYVELDLPSDSALVFNNSDTLSYTLPVGSNTNWRIRDVPEWLTVSPTSGINDGTVKFSVSYNATGSDRAGSFSIVTDDAAARSTSVSVFQPAAFLSVAGGPFVFAASGGSVKLELTSNTVWSVSSTLPQVSFAPASGSGGASVSVVSQANATRRRLAGFMLFKYAGKLSDSIAFDIESQPNKAPSAPVPVFPSEGAEEVSRAARFEWQPSADDEGDSVSYAVSVSRDGASWDTVAVTNSCFAYATSLLDSLSSYYWKVSATDSNYLGDVASEAVRFRTGRGGVIADGSYRCRIESSVARPTRIVFLGDGFIDEDLMEGNSEYDAVMDEAVEYFFSCEPMKSYRDYFEVWTVYAESGERGWSSPSHISNTAFRVSWAGEKSTALSCNYTKVYDYVRKIPSVDNLDETVVVLISNQRSYAGTCYMWTSGSTLAMVPRCSPEVADDDQTSFKSVLLHESAGHALGRLADEYVTSSGAITAAQKDSLMSYQRRGIFMNVSVTDDSLSAPWADFLLLEDYPLVGFFEGAYYFKTGVWRSEDRSAMVDNIHYFPAVGRYAIVKRVLEGAGEECTLADFMANDVVRSPFSGRGVYRQCVPLSPPKVFDGAPLDIGLK